MTLLPPTAICLPYVACPSQGKKLQTHGPEKKKNKREKERKNKEGILQNSSQTR